jgi:2-keto-4-pentenoate hydratase/2-oxohepta-3-ene-1,7-dioic acid hydratase in catechol pathway
MSRHVMVATLLLLLVPPVMEIAPGADARAPATYVRFQAGNTVAYGLIADGKIRQIDGDLFGPRKLTGKTYGLADVKLLVPVQPSKVLALAGNYKSHLGDKAAPKNPELFFKVPSCLIASGEPIVIPPGTNRVDHEGELVIVIGKRATKVSKERALDYVLGVTCGNDVSARDWQKNDVQWWRAKGSDTFGPCGPVIASGINYDDLNLVVRVNDQVRQQQRTKDLVFGVAAIVSFASQHVTLEPGDLIFTGTPGTTTAIKPGDMVQVELEGVGVLANPVIAAPAKKAATRGK